MAQAPVVILGLEIGDPDSIENWARQGRLPTIAALMQRGWWGRTAGPELACEHGAALSLFSGVSRSRHGYYNFRRLKPGSYELEPCDPADAGVLPFWAYLRGRDKRVAVIDVPEVGCVAELPGVQMADAAALGHDERAVADPPEMLREARRAIGPRVRRSFLSNRSLEQDRQIYVQLREQVERKGTFCRQVLRRDRFDLIAAVFDETHTASHQFWKYQRLEEPGADDLGHAIRDLYEALDRQMGLLLAELPPEANVFLFSLFGMQTNYPTPGLNDALCRQLGYHAAPPPGPASFRPLDLARRFVPEPWRFALSQHLPRQAQERLLADQIRRGTDWRKTTAFTIPSLFTAFVRVNLRDREPEGIVEPGAGYEEVLARLEGDLAQLVYAHSGEPAVERVTRTCRLFGGGPPQALPDLFVDWKPADHFVERVTHPRAVLMQRKPAFCPGSEEKLSGFVAAAGPAVERRGGVGDVSVLDLAPTWLRLLGEPIPGRLTGRALH